MGNSPHTGNVPDQQQNPQDLLDFKVRQGPAKCGRFLMVRGFLPMIKQERAIVASPTPPRRFDSIREAMDAVLEAEREAQLTMTETRREADDIIARAREKARQIQARTQDRITRMHASCEARTAAAVKAMKKEAVAALSSAARDRDESAAIQRAALRLAERMTTPHERN